jgi:hypothetical protein
MRYLSNQPFAPIRVVLIGIGPLVPEHFDLNGVALTTNLNSVCQTIAPKGPLL